MHARRMVPSSWPHKLLCLAAAAAVASGYKAADEDNPDSDFVQYEPATPVGADGAFVDCPCKDWFLLAQGDRGGTCKAWGSPEGAWKDDPCRSVDVDKRPSWCQYRWCYVDPGQCVRGYLPDPQHYGRHYSYETCGDVGTHFVNWQDLPLTERMGRPLRVWASGFRIKTYTDLRVGMNLDMRASLSFASKMLEQLRVPPDKMEYRQLSNYSKQHYPNSQYTACVYDIALGNVDLCVGPVWDTDERRAMNVTFTGSVFFEDYYLLVPKDLRGGASFNSMFWKTFQPFSSGLWCVIFATVAASCLAVVAFDHWFTPTEAMARLGPQRSTMTTATGWLHSFLAGEVCFMPATSGGKVFSVGYGFFILVCISCYTANMATILIAEDQGVGRIESIEDAMRLGQKVCYHAAVPKDAINRIYPHLDQLGTAVDGSVAGLDIWKHHGCKVSIVSEMMMADDYASGAACDYVFLRRQRPVMIVPNGFYSSNALGHEISWMASRLRMRGEWEDTRQQVEKPSLCHQEEDNGLSQMKTNHLLGPLAVLALFFLAGLVVHSYELRNDVDCGHLGLAADTDSDNDNDTEMRKSLPDPKMEAKGRETRHLLSSPRHSSSRRSKSKLEAHMLPQLMRLQAQLQQSLAELEELRASSVATPKRVRTFKDLMSFR